MPDRAKRNVLLTIVKTIINDERIRRVAPLSVELLEAEWAKYRAIEAAVAAAMQEPAGGVNAPAS